MLTLGKRINFVKSLSACFWWSWIFMVLSCRNFCVIEEELELHFDVCGLGCFSLLGFEMFAV
jgi:hypothetical protein